MEPAPPFQTFPTAADFKRASARRGRVVLFWVLLLAALCGVSMVSFNNGSPLLTIVLLVSVGGLLLLWHRPKISLSIAFASTCLFEILPVKYADSITEQIPFFWNINTIFQTYLHVGFKAVPLNLLEVILIVAAVMSLIQAVALKQVDVRLGPLFTPIFIYICFVMMGWINGMATGGDFKLSLQEVRAQFYFLIAYLMAVNIIRAPAQTRRLFWIAALCIGLKGILYTFRRYVTLAGLPLPDQGVGSHEEAFFFNTFVALLTALVICGQQGRLRRIMWFLLPLVITGNLATNRRAATAAMVIAVPVLLMVAYRVLPERRRLIGWGAALLVVVFSLYYQAFKNSGSMIAQPARAIKSQFQPSDRDASSNQYRDAENACLIATVKVAPIQGYGYGKRMLHAVPIADISKEYEWWDVMTHNQVLWVWMRTGTFGFIAFWMMISSILIFLCRTLISPDISDEAKAVGIFTILTVSMLMIFGLLDLQFSNFRDMLFTGFWVGVAAGLPNWKKKERGEKALDVTAESLSSRAPLLLPSKSTASLPKTETPLEEPVPPSVSGSVSNSGLAARNFLASLVTQLLSWGLTFAVTLFLPRYAGVNGMGELAVAGAFVAIFGVLASLGTTTVLIKEIARDHSCAGKLLSGALLVRVPLAILLAVAAYGSASLMQYSPELRLLVLVAALGMVLATINEALGAVLQGMENLTRQGFGILTDKFLLSGLTIVFIFLKQPLWAIAAIGIVTASVSCAVNLYSLRSILPGLIRWPGIPYSLNLIKAGIAFMGISVYTTLYGQSDPLILKLVASEQAVGWYTTAFRLIGTTMFLPVAINAALVPTLSRLFASDNTQFKALAQRMLVLVSLCAVPVSLILLIAPHRLIELLHYPSGFDGSIPVLRIGGIAVLLNYLTVIIGAVIIASDRQTKLLSLFAKSCVFGIPGCFLLTYLGHRYFQNGAVGAILSDTLLELYILAGLLHISKDICSLRQTLSILGRLLLAAIPMTLLLLWATDARRSAEFGNGLWTIAPGLILYGIGCLWLRCIDTRMLDGFQRIVRRRSLPVTL